MTTEELKKLPKVELHCHLDGSLSREFIEKQLGRSVEESEIRVPDDCQSLGEYLEKFRLPIACLKEDAAFTEAGYDILKTMSGENIRYAEIRFAPLTSATEEIKPERVIEALLKGLAKGEQDFGVAYNVIVCAMRHRSEEENYGMIKAAREFLGAGVCAADLAGGELQSPMSEFMSLFQRVKKLGMPFVLHAGECGSAENVVDALRAGASRIGHGIAMQGRKDLQELVKKSDVGVEICLTSNIQTKAVESAKDHPLREFLDAGLPVTINTDNRTLSATSLTRELEFAQKMYNVSDEEILRCMKNAVRLSFADDALKEKLYRGL